jgi:hypothetical protein
MIAASPLHLAASLVSFAMDFAIPEKKADHSLTASAPKSFYEKRITFFEVGHNIGGLYQSAAGFRSFFLDLLAGSPLRCFSIFLPLRRLETAAMAAGTDIMAMTQTSIHV